MILIHWSRKPQTNFVDCEEKIKYNLILKLSCKDFDGKNYGHTLKQKYILSKSD